MNNIGLTANCNPPAAPLTDARKVFATLYLTGTTGVFASAGSILGLSWLGGVLFVPLYAGLLAFIASAIFNGARIPLGRALALFALVAGLTTSALLSYKPIGAFANVVLLMLDLLFAVWLSSWASIEDFRRLLLRALLVMFLLSLPVAVINHGLLIYNDPLERANVLGFANYKGLFPHKIHAGIYNSIGAVFAWSLYRETTKQRYAWMTALFLVLTASAGSSVALVSMAVGGFAAWLVLKTMQRYGGVMLAYGAAWAVFFLVLFVLFDLYPLLMTELGRDPSMTGRLPIWQFGLRYIAEHPFIGGGYGVFFDVAPNSPAQALWLQSRWYTAPSFHSGYVQLLAEAGLVGGTGFFVLLLVAAARALGSRQLWLVWLVLTCVVANFGAALFVTHRSLLFVGLAFIAFSASIPIGIKPKADF